MRCYKTRGQTRTLRHLRDRPHFAAGERLKRALELAFVDVSSACDVLVG